MRNRKEIVSEGVKIFGFGNEKVLAIAKDILKKYDYINIHWSLKDGCGEWSEEHEVFFYDFSSQSFWKDSKYDNLDTLLKSLEEVKSKEGLDPDSLVLRGHWRKEEVDLKTIEGLWSKPSYDYEDITEISSIMDLYKGVKDEIQQQVFYEACILFEHAKENY